jgi:putative ABC transport system ATP-binding protein
VVRCSAVSRTFTRGAVQVRAVRDVYCTVEAGVRVAVTGPSGSGKSTLLHLMAGLDRPTDGIVEWPLLGEGAPHSRPGTTGVVFQGPSLVPALDVVENVALPLQLAGVGEREAIDRATAALDLLELCPLVARLPDELSGGQAQRVAVARVLASRPALILADEPTGQLDRDTAVRVIAVLLHAADELGAALVVATHDLAIAARLPHRWRMTDGRLVSGETP